MDIVKTGSGRLQLKLEPVDMKSLLQGSAMQVSPLAQNKEHKLSLELAPSLPIIHGNGQRLEQVVLNLLSNTIKFTPKGGNIVLKASKDDTSLLVEVQDNGIGIATEAHLHLFKPYSRLSAYRQSHPGLGLGLALSK